MSPRGMPIDAEELLAQARWVGHLARKLVRDACHADDVVQDTWLAALQSAPAEQEALRPWLARVVHNFARQSKRSEANRARREEESARHERSPSASETTERLEAQRVLVEALEALAEPYRTTVTLRYLEGLSAAQIARKLGVPAGTVRWRLKQGLDELRAKLEKRFGGPGGSWAVALLPLLRRPPLAEIAVGISKASVATVVEGLTIMSTMTKVGIGVAVLAASAGVWFAIDRSGSPVVASRGTGSLPVPPALSESPAVATTEEPVKSQEAQSRETAANLGGAPAAEAPATATAHLEARFVDPDGHPLPGVQLEVEAGKLGRAESASDGKCGLDVTLQKFGDAWVVKLVARCTNRATVFTRATLRFGETTFLGDIVMQPGGAIAGIVLGPDGNPFAGADVLATQPDLSGQMDVARMRGPRNQECPRATSAADGSFQVDGVPTSPVRLWAGSHGMRWTLSAPIEVRASEVDRGIQLRLEGWAATDRIEGIVLAPDATPVAGAELNVTHSSAGTSSGTTERTGKDGRFRILVEHPVPHDLHVLDPEGRWPPFSAVGVPPGSLDLTLRFPEPRWIDLEVRGPDGAGIEKFQLRLSAQGGTQIRGEPSGEDHPAGKARLMLPDLPFYFEIAARGFAPRRFGLVDPATLSSPWICTLDPLPIIVGRVTAGSHPVPGARVALRRMAVGTDFAQEDGFQSRLLMDDLDATTTKADGNFELYRGEGTYLAILCDAAGFARAEVSPLTLSPADPGDIEIALTPGGSIEGRVIPLPAHDASGTIVAVSRYDGRAFTKRVGPDGRFAFAHLTPGKWKVQRVSQESSGTSSSASGSHGEPIPELPWNCIVQDGSTTRFDLDLSSELPCTLVTSLMVNGRTASGWMVTLHPDRLSFDRGGNWPGGTLNSEGGIRLEVPDAGAYVVSLQPPAETARRGSFEGKVEIRSGENSWSAALSTGSLNGKLATPDSSSYLSYRWEREGLTFYATCPVDAEGKFSFPVVPAGSGTLSRSIRVDARTITPGPNRPVDVPAGGAVEVEAP